MTLVLDDALSITRRTLLLLCLSAISIIPTVLTESTNDELAENEMICLNQTTCGKCISASPICTWCKNKSFLRIRCDKRETLLSNGCPSSDIIDPKTELNLIENKNTSDGLTAVQMKPQKIRLRLRPHEKVELPFEFYLAQDYAVDMYFLMDLSNTMKVHIEQLAQVSKQLVDDIRKLTKYLKVGIGSFVDKNTLPYSLADSCLSSSCGEKYSFKQMIKLTNTFSEFTTTVDKLKNLTTENLDSPEAGMDAVMQSIVCENEIGWRKESRRLLIYSSDAPFHFAGDGKLGGIMIPNDGRCHLSQNKYLMDKDQDYPSVGQIAQKIQENQVTVIFAVSNNRLKTYQDFVKNIRGAYVSELNTKTSTIAEIVKERYMNISSRVEITSLNKDVNITFMSKCSGSEWMTTNQCDHLKPRQRVDFKAIISPQKCDKNGMKKIVILPIGLKQKLEIELELICGCECEKQSQKYSPNCDGIGDLTCGKCYCDNPALFEKCRMYNTTTECSGRGSCDCGKCFCEKIPKSQNYFYGEYCECSNYSCPNFNGTICGGPTHGKCICGKCHCESEFSGENCGCPVDQTPCLSKNNKLCNGYGTCVCGVCQCEPNLGYKGKTCENCPTCGQCGKFEDCVKCVFTEPTKQVQNCTERCYDVKVEFVDVLTNEKKLNEERDACMVEIQDCIVRYKNEIDKLIILRKKDCKKKINLVSLIIGIIGGIFLIGIFLLVLWKVITTVQDRRELARFNRERDNAKWTPQSNPLYVNASTTFQNPMWNSNPEL